MSPSSSLERPGGLVRRLCSEIPPLGRLHLCCDGAGAVMEQALSWLLGTRYPPLSTHLHGRFFPSKTACFLWGACRGKRSGWKKKGLILSCLICALKKREVGIYEQDVFL